MLLHERTLTLGAVPESAGTRFRVWAPAAHQVHLELLEPEGTRVVPLVLDAYGHFSTIVPDAVPGTRYRYRLDQGPSVPDPASRCQPEGVHGPSEVVDLDAYPWSDAGWSGLTMEGLVIYELHIGTFTPGGTFDAAIERLDYLVDLGVTAIEVMPIANFPGHRNWGYDGVNLYAPATAYGGPHGFQRLVDAAHQRGLGVILDVVYNHLGPEGNYLPAVTGGRFFTSRHHTPWGDAVNFDGPDSGPVRDFVLQNALYWAQEYHVDGLRLDAVHAIRDDSPRTIVQDIARELHRLTPRRLVIAEDETNDRRLVLPPGQGGAGLDGVWADDFHHQLQRILAGDHEGYYSSYRDSVEDLARTLNQGWLFQGEYAEFFGGPRGSPAGDLAPASLVYCIQNHDQVGNRALGDRLHRTIPPAAYRAASALLLLGPYTPLLWMGQEWAASTPFLYFTDHPAELGRAVTQGRREEFRHFAAFHDPDQRARIPDPQDEATWRRSVLRWDEASHEPHVSVRRLYRTLLQLRQDEPWLQHAARGEYTARATGPHGLLLLRRGPDGRLRQLVVSLAGPLEVELPGDGWRQLLSTESPRFGGTGGEELEGSRVRLAGPGAVLVTNSE